MLGGTSGSTLQYEPRSDAAEPQRFLYSTRLGFGLVIRGKGETVASLTDAAGKRTSALKFWSDVPISLIREGSSYWQHDPTPAGVRFLTDYNYTRRFRGIGRVLDWLLYRPLIGWATAWSFDRLRLWLQKGTDAAVSLQRTIIHAVARAALAFLRIYEGMVPQLVYPNSGEVAIPRQARLFAGHEPVVVRLVRVVEVVFGLLSVIRSACSVHDSQLRLSRWLRPRNGDLGALLPDQENATF